MTARIAKRFWIRPGDQGFHIPGDRISFTGRVKCENTRFGAPNPLLAQPITMAGEMSIGEKSMKVAEARKIVRHFPTHRKRAVRSREMGQRIVAVAFVGDLLMILSGLLLSFYIRFLTPIREWGIYARPALADYLGYMILASVVYSEMLCYGGVYDHRNLLKLRLVTARILKWSIAWIGFILLVSFMLKFEPPVSRVYCLIAWVITPSMLVGWRGLFQLLLIRSSALSAFRQRVVFVGWNQHSAHLARNFMHSPSSGY